MQRLADLAFVAKPQAAGELARRLVSEAGRVWSDVSHLRELNITQLWRIARDVVDTMDRWGDSFEVMPGKKKMEVALEVVWGFVEGQGGLGHFRDLVAKWVPGPGFIKRWLINRLINRELARRMVQFVIELAVRSAKKHLT